MLTHLSLLVLAVQALAIPGPGAGVVRPRDDDALLDQPAQAQVPLGIDIDSHYLDLAPDHPISRPPFDSSSQASTSTQERYDGHQVWRVDWHRIPAAIRDEIVGLLDVSTLAGCAGVPLLRNAGGCLGILPTSILSDTTPLAASEASRMRSKGWERSPCMHYL